MAPSKLNNFPRSSATTSSTLSSCLSTASRRDDESPSDRVENLKKRFAGLIDKSQKALIKNNTNPQVVVVASPIVKSAGNPTVKAKSKNRKRGIEKTLISQAKQSNVKRQRVSSEDVVRKKNDFFFDLTALAAADVSKKKKKAVNTIEEKEEAEKKEKENARKLEIQKLREAARKKIEAMSDDAGICDPQQAMRDFAKLIGYESVMHRPHVSPYATAPPATLPLHIIEKQEKLVKGSSLVNHCSDEPVEVEEGEITD